VLSPTLLAQAKTASTFGDALRMLGPAYVARNDATHTIRWHFGDGSTLTPWPQGGETLSDAVSIYPNPACKKSSVSCTDLILGRRVSTAEYQYQDSPYKDEGTPQDVTVSSPYPTETLKEQNPNTGATVAGTLGQAATVRATNTLA